MRATDPTGSVSNTRLSRAMVRQELEQRLLLDCDLEAFCLDHFPQTQRLFSAGMNRQEKLNLLLSREDIPRIAAALGIPSDRASSSHTGPLDDSVLLNGSVSRVSPHREWVLGGRTVLLVLTIGIVGVLGFRPKIRPAERPVGNPIVQSSPSSAELWDMTTGRLLGKTPWVITQSLLPRVVCLQKAGYRHEVLSLSSDPFPQVEVKLQPSKSVTEEVCDVPVPIP